MIIFVKNFMRKIIPKFISLFLILSFEAKPQKPLEKTIFWQISGNGLKDTSYLFGTAHPIFRQDVYIADTVLKVLEKSSTVFFEINPSGNRDSIHKANNIMSKPRLRNLLGNVSYKLLVKTLEELQDTIINDPLFHSLSPQYFNGRMMKQIFGNRLTSVDDSLYTIVRANNKQALKALDTKEMREEMDERVPMEAHANNLYALLQNMDKGFSAFVKTIKGFAAWYYAGDIEAIYTKNSYVSILVGDRAHLMRKPVSEEVLDKRNKKWIKDIIPAINTSPSFFAVGAAHLAGEGGLINLLRKKGYTVSPIFLQYKR
jgi:uncharacterized protein